MDISAFSLVQTLLLSKFGHSQNRPCEDHNTSLSKGLTHMGLPVAARQGAALPCGGSGFVRESGGALLVEGGVAAPHMGLTPQFATPSHFIFYYFLTAHLRRSFLTKKTPFTLEKTPFTLNKMDPVHFISIAKGPHLILG